MFPISSYLDQNGNFIYVKTMHPSYAYAYDIDIDINSNILLRAGATGEINLNSSTNILIL